MVHVEGVPDTWHVTDKDGKIVEVHVPAHSLIDIQTSQEERPSASGTSGQGTGTVLATVVAVDTLTKRVKVQTQAGQVIEPKLLPKTARLGNRSRSLCPDNGTELG